MISKKEKNKKIYTSWPANFSCFNFKVHIFYIFPKLTRKLFRSLFLLWQKSFDCFFFLPYWWIFCVFLYFLFVYLFCVKISLNYIVTWFSSFGMITNAGVFFLIGQKKKSNAWKEILSSRGRLFIFKYEELNLFNLRKMRESHLNDRRHSTKIYTKKMNVYLFCFCFFLKNNRFVVNAFSVFFLCSSF